MSGRTSAAEVPSREEEPVTVKGKGGRPEGDRYRWTITMYTDDAVRELIDAVAERLGQPVAGVTLDLYVAKAAELGIPVPPAWPDEAVLEELRNWGAKYDGFITTDVVAERFELAPARANEALEAAGFTKRRAGTGHVWARPRVDEAG